MARLNKPSLNNSNKGVKHYFYPNLYYLLGVYALIALIVVFLFPIEASFESVLGVGIVSLSALVISLTAGPIHNVKTIENAWLKNAAASSFITMFACLIIGTSFALLNVVSWQLVNYAIVAVVVIDFLGKLIIAKKRDS